MFWELLLGKLFQMYTYEDKLGILSELIEFAQVDLTIKDSEYDFLLSIAHLLEVKKASLDKLLKGRRPIKKTFSQLDKIVQFHRLLLLMNVDNEQQAAEVARLHNIGLRMGLPPNAISQVLEVMHQYPNKIIPPDVLLGIFKAYQN